MTIARKLFQIATIGLSLGSFNASAYDVVGLKDEVLLISAFAKNHYNDTVEYNNWPLSLGRWLEKKIYHTYTTNNYTIIELANIIKQDNIDQLLYMMKQELDSLKFREDIVKAVLLGVVSIVILDMILQTLDLHINSKIFDKTFPTNMQTLITLDKMQQQINDLTQKVDKKTLMQRLFAKQ